MATASFLIDRGEWGRFKNKDLASLLSQLRDLIYDAEDLLRELDDQVLRQKIEDADRSRAGQLLSSSLYLAKHLFNRTQTRVKETQDGLDKVMAQTEVVLHLLGLNVKPGQLMPETSSIISASQVFGRDSERDSVIEMLGVKIGREDERDQVIKQLVVPLTKGCRSAGSKGKKAATSQGVGVALASASGAKRLKGNTTRAVPAETETNCTDIVSVLPIVGIGGVGKTTLAQLVYSDHRVRCNFGLRIWVCVSDLFDMRGITKEIVESISGKQFSQSCSLNTLQEELKEQLTSPKCRKFLLVLDDFPDKYVVHDLIHDMAKSVSVDECFSIQELCYLQNRRRMPHTVRHMSIHETHSESFRAHPVNPEQALKRIDIRHLSKLHSLRIGPRFCNEITWFNQLSNILYLNLEGCNFIKLPESIWELNSLRYLDISHSYVQELPKKFWCLYNLQVLDARSCGLHVISDITITRPMNIRVLPKIVSGALSSEVSGLGNLSYLRNLSKFTVGREYGRRISELKSMNQLSGTLSVTSLYNVQSAEEAAEARLFDKQYLKKLILQWEDGRVFGQPRPGENGVIEGLRPHSRIEHLEFHDFWGDRLSTTWFRSEDLPNLRSLVLNRCLYLKSLSIPYLASLEQLELTEVGIECLTTFPAAGVQAGSTGHDRTQYASSSNSFSNGAASSTSSFTFTRLTALYIFGCNQLKNLEQFLTPENMPSLKQMTLRNCDALVSIPVHTFVGFVCLQDLKISGCDKLTCPREMVLPPSLLRLCTAACGELDRSFPACLESLTSLTVLQLVSCHNIKYIPLIAGTKCLILCYCPELSSIGGSHGLSSIQHVDISNCPKLTEVEQPFTKKELIRAEADDLLKF